MCTATLARRSALTDERPSCGFANRAELALENTHASPSGEERETALMARSGLEHLEDRRSASLEPLEPPPLSRCSDQRLDVVEWQAGFGGELVDGDAVSIQKLQRFG